MHFFLIIFSEEFQQHAHHVDIYIEQIMKYLQEKHLNKSKYYFFDKLQSVRKFIDQMSLFFLILE